MASLKNKIRARLAPGVSTQDHDALKRRVTKLTKTVDNVVVREARLQEELAMLRREVIAMRDAPANK